MRRRPAALLGACLVALLTTPTLAAADEDLEVPDDVTIPRTEVQFETVQTFVYPRTQVTIHQADPQDSDRDELLETFDAEQGPDGTVLTMPDRVLFDFGESDLRPTAEDRLTRLLRLLEDTEGTIRVEGHTDDIGGDDINQPLSEDRAEAVADHLTDNGVDADRIETDGLADREPVEPNQHDDGSDYPEGRQANRRVEVIVELD